ncbi:uncharacterized protein [Periplaneta americana]|uniref:uncharacterized protein n=1 Tax=Periplaneta americana TaxID=6978 RepID=UPI0037E9C0CD
MMSADQKAFGNTGNKIEEKYRITNICEEDKQKITQLIEEYAKCNEEKTAIEEKFINWVTQERKREEQFTKLINLKSRKLKELQNTIEALKTEMQLCKQKKEEMTTALMSDNEEMKKTIEQLNSELQELKDYYQNIELSLASNQRKLMKYKSVIKKMASRSKGHRTVNTGVQTQHADLTKNMGCQTSDDNFRIEEGNSHHGSLSSVNIEDTLISELFFSAPNVPEQLEPIFFLPPSTSTQDVFESQSLLNKM